MPLLRSALLFSAGGDVFAKYGTLTRRYQIPQLGGEGMKETFARTSAATSHALLSPGVLGVVQTQVGAPRLHYVQDPVSALLKPTWLVDQLGATNRLLQSQALATTWTASLLTPTNNSAAAPDSSVTATLLVPTAVSSAAHRVSQPVTITANEFVAFSVYIKTSGYNAVRIQIVDAATSLNGFVLRFDASTGLFGTNNLVGSGSLTGAAIEALGNGWYRVLGWGSLGGGITAAICIIDVFDTIADANGNTAFTGNGTSGVLAWGAQWERNGTSWSRPPTAYIPTTTGTATRSGETATITWGLGPVDMTIYASGYDMTGLVPAATNSGLLQLGDTAFVNPRAYFNRNANLWAFAMANDAGAARSGNVANTTAYGDFYEVVSQYGSQGFQMFEAKNGGAFVGGTPQSGISMGSKWNQQILSLTPSFGGIFAHRAIKIISGFVTPADAQALAV
jgi:hypothetical protein